MLKLGDSVVLTSDESRKGMVVGTKGENIVVVFDDNAVLALPETDLIAVNAVAEAALTQALTMLARARAQRDEVQRKVDAAHKAYIEQHAETLSALDDQKANVSTIELATRSLVAALYEATGDKHPHTHVQVAITDTVVIEDEAKAIRWAINEGNATVLQLNAKFKNLAKAGSVPAEIATVVKTPTIKLSTDLNDMLHLSADAPDAVVETPAAETPAADAEPKEAA